jgi:hypothetical protein
MPVHVRVGIGTNPASGSGAKTLMALGRNCANGETAFTHRL